MKVWKIVSTGGTREDAKPWVLQSTFTFQRAVSLAAEYQELADRRDAGVSYTVVEVSA